MRKSNVRVISIDRARSGITDAADPIHCEWRVFFRLSPRPTKEWDAYFERARMEQQLENSLEYKHRLVRESRVGDYFYGSSRRRFGYLLRRILGRRLAYGVEVTCAPSSDDLTRATNELAHLVAYANSCYVAAGDTHRETNVAARVATDRLAAALGSVEKSLKKNTVVMPSAAPKQIKVMHAGKK